jgi:hypothetical protein
VLKLIYHTAVFGPIGLEYDRLVIRVGRSEDNDLVLRHPSVEPYHCLLVFRDEKVLYLPPRQTFPSQSEVRSLTGPELGAGDLLRIGELQFSLAHSSKTVAVPEVLIQGSTASTMGGEAGTRTGAEANPRRYYCAHCQTFYHESEVKRFGLVGHPKRSLCPKCSHVFETEPEPEKPRPDVKKQSRRSWFSGAGH